MKGAEEMTKDITRPDKEEHIQATEEVNTRKSLKFVSAFHLE
jgi:hypothetical protein